MQQTAIYIPPSDQLYLQNKFQQQDATDVDDVATPESS
jgi:hypothetical protein